MVMFIDPEHHVARYCKKATVESGYIMSAAFLPRPSEEGISVSWLEFFSPNREDAMVEIRRHINLDLDQRARFALLNVGEVRRLGLEVEHARSFKDPSHSLILGFGEIDQVVADQLRELAIANGIVPAIIA